MNEREKEGKRERERERGGGGGRGNEIVSLNTRSMGLGFAKTAAKIDSQATFRLDFLISGSSDDRFPHETLSNKQPRSVSFLLV